jgi:hypothetical protein
MGEIIDFKCAAGNDEGLSAAEIKGLGLAFPDAHKHKDTIMAVSKKLKDKNRSDFCELPFCHT